MKLFNFLAKSHVSKALQIYPIYYYGRAVTKIMKKKIERKNEEEKNIPAPLTSQIFKDLLENNDSNGNSTKATLAKTINQIETFPDLLDEDDIVKAVQKVTPTIDQTFIKDIKLSGKLEEEQWKKIKKKIRMFPSYSLIKIAKTFSDFPKFHKMDSIWIPLENEFSTRLKNMSFDEIVQMLWCFAYSNRKSREFFRRIENELYDRDWNYAHINHIGKMLWAFSFADLGSVELYSKMADTIKVVQYEIPPMKIAEYANYFSKSSEAVQGGFGIYKVAEKRLTETLKDYNFHQLIKIALLLIPQSIGSNEFYSKLEEKIIENFPNREEISLPDLVRLVKATSNFKNESIGLNDKIENNVIKYVQFMSNSQIEESLWAFSRGRKGSKALYEKFESEILKRINLFKARSLAFAYYGFSSMKNGSTNFYEVFNKKIEEKINEFNPHCLLKILKGMQIINSVDFELRDLLIAKLLNSKNLKISEMIKLIMIVNESNISISMENMKLYSDIFEGLMLKIEQNLPFLKIDEICQIFYSYVLHNKFNETSFNMVLQEIPSANSVPKSIFCQMLWAIIQSKHFEFAKEFIPIINNLKTFGDIKYFFDHDNFIKLSWSLIISKFNVEGKTDYYSLDNAIWETIKEAMLSINPNTLKAIENVGLWLQTLTLLNTVVEVKEEQLKDKVSELSDYTKKQLASCGKLNINYKESDHIREEITQLIEEIVAKHPIKGVEIDLIKTFYDDFFNFVDIALICNQKHKLGIRIRKKRDYLFEDSENKDFFLMTSDMNDRILENVFGWKLLILDEDDYKQKGINEKKFLIGRFLKKIK